MAKLSDETGEAIAEAPLPGLERDVAPDAKTLAANPSSTMSPVRKPDAAGLSALVELRRLREDVGGAKGIVTLRTLGEGGMGIVKLGTQVGIGRQVAVKSLRPESADETSVLRLMREAWITGALEHPSIVPIYEVRVDDHGLPLIVLKRIHGQHWGELLASAERARSVFGSEMGESDIFAHHLRILIQVANAVHFAHDRRIIHRDLKPENVMIGSFGEVYVLDWGLAVSLDPDPSGRFPLASDSVEMAGTPCYMAPEMFGGTGALSERTDVYLLGAILFEIIEGAAPHSGKTIMEIIRQALTSEPAFSERAPAELVAICRRAMAREPADRFESAQTFRVAVEEFLTHQGSVRIADRAAGMLRDLREHTSFDAGDPEGRARRILGSYGAARFGFRAALDAWPGNEEAARGLAEATSLIVEYELAHGNPHTAASLLGELDAPPEHLRRRVFRKLREKGDQDRRRAALERDRDLGVGARTRVKLAIALGAIWTVAPIFARYVIYVHRPPTHASTILSSTFFLSILLTVLGIGRASLIKTAVDRGLIGATLFALLAHILLEIGAFFLDVPEISTQVLKLFLWFVVISLSAFLIDRRMTPTAGVILAGFFLASRRPEWVFEITSVVNLLAMITLTFIWWPRAVAAAATSTRTGPAERPE